ncbi:MAG TPA: 3D domain-containing protein [Bacilli bacterium]|nr:3D domain-containing protein [Bacilli bacterium]
MKQKIINSMIVICVFYGLLLIVVGYDIILFVPTSIKENIVENTTISSTVSKEVLKENYISLKKRSQSLSSVFYDNFFDAVKNAEEGITSFNGKLTHYGPDCKGCGGRTACKGIDVRNGNIYYEDPEYGKIRIVAADRSLPCGSIIKININKYDEDGMYAIVLDRGGIIKGARIDLLKVSETAKSPVRTVNSANFDIIRLGYYKT